MFVVSSQLKLLVLLLQRQEPTELCPGKQAAIAGSLALGISADTVKAAQAHVLGAVQIVVTPLAASGKQQVGAGAQVLATQDTALQLVVTAISAGTGSEPLSFLAVKAHIAQLVLKAPVSAAVAVRLITIDGQDTCITVLVSIGEVKGSVLILKLAVLITQASVEIVLLAAVDSIVKANRSNLGSTITLQFPVLLAQMVAQHVVAQGHLQTIRKQRRGVVETIVVKVTASSQAAYCKMVTFLGKIQEIVVDTHLTVAGITVAVVVHGDKALLALMLIEVNLHMHSPRLAALGKGSLGISAGQVGQQPNGALEPVLSEVLALFQAADFTVHRTLTDIRMVPDRQFIKASNHNSILHYTIGDFLHRQIHTHRYIAVLAEISCQIISAGFQILEGHQTALALFQHRLELLLRENILTGNLETLDLYLQLIRQVQLRTLLGFIHLSLAAGKLHAAFFTLRPMFLGQRTGIGDTCHNSSHRLLQAHSLGSCLCHGDAIASHHKPQSHSSGNFL